MRWKVTQLALWTVGQADAGGLVLPDAAASVPPLAANHWPWVALGGIALLLAVIALCSRRRLPFGGRP